jgi:hypothetical protein
MYLVIGAVPVGGPEQLLGDFVLASECAATRS